MGKTVYFDNAATTSVDPAVFEEMRPYFSRFYGNPMTADHSSLGEHSRSAVEKARGEVAALIGACAEQVAFTSGGTESDNWAIKSAVERAMDRGRKGAAHVVSSVFEHPAVLNSIAALRRRGVEASFARVGRDGVVDLEDVRRVLRDNTVLVSVMHANNELGTIQPIALIAEMAHERGALLHVDAVQSAGHLAIDVKALGADFLSVSAHKFNGPKGAGALYAKDWSSLYPYLDGGSQEWGGMRGSTHDVPGIVGLGTAAKLAMERLQGERRRLLILRDRLLETLSARIPGMRINGDALERLPHILNVRLDGIDNQALLAAMNQAGVIASGCSACHIDKGTVSHALSAIGLSAAEARSSIRFSLGYATTAEDVEYACSVVPGLVRALRSIARQER